MIPATSIDEVLTRLTAVIAESEQTRSRAGYFAALYYKMTSSVKQGIVSNMFQNGPRMERLDVTFASRYLVAYDIWKAGGKPTGPWQVAFETTDKASALVLQQLFLGINAHINFDLGIAAAETMKGENYEELRNDFNVINSLIASNSNKVIRELDTVSPLLSLLGLHASRYNNILISFSIDGARDGAWCFGEELSQLTGSAYDEHITRREQDVTKIAQSLIHATQLLRLTLWVIHLFEWKNPSKIIKMMNESKKPYLKMEQME